MIHYTPLFPDEIFEEESDGQLVQLSVDHAMVTMRKLNDGYEIVQLTSTNPNDYLKKHLNPGYIYR